MRRAGVDYWAHSPPAAPPPPSHSVLRRSVSSSSGPPSLSHTSTADFFVADDDARPTRADLSEARTVRAQPSTLRPPPPPPPASSPPLSEGSDRGGIRRELERSRRQVSLLQQQRSEAEDKARRVQAAWSRDAVEHANALRTVQAALERERALRTAAEGERQNAAREAHQLRAALRALLAQPLSRPAGGENSDGHATVDSAPLTLYAEARNLLLRCERTFDELKMLQVKATDAAGLERLRSYDVPVLDGIPPAWPPDTPQKPVRERGGVGDAADARTPNPAAVALSAGATATVEETPTGPEVSALTTVSPDTPSSPCVPQRSPSLPQRTSQPLVEAKINQREEKGKEEVATAAQHSAPIAKKAAEAAPPHFPAQAHGGTANRGPPRVPLLSPFADDEEERRSSAHDRNNDGAAVNWAGPMHVHAHSNPPPSASTPLLSVGAVVPAPPLQPLPGAALSEFDREDVIRNTDALLSQLAQETAALAKTQGITSSADVAALCYRRGLDYVDAAFLPVTATLGLASGGCRGYDPDRGVAYVVQWCSRDAFVPRGRRAELLTSAGVDPNALRCGALGDSGVVAALAALAEAAGAVTSVLASTTSEDEDNGHCMVWLCVRGWWTRTTVDAYLPCVCEPDGRVTLYGCSNVATHDLWGPMCEKALAKVYGSYAALAPLSADVVLAHLTGGPVECWEWWRRRSDVALAEIDAALTTNARGAGMVMLTTHAVTSSTAYQRLGLRTSTSYRVLAVSESADGEPMLLLRNWTAASSAEKDMEAGEGLATAMVNQRNVSPLREDTDGLLLRFISDSADVEAPQRDSRGGSGGRAATGCLWLRYRTEVLPLFDRCHVCFDCRRYHDARYSIDFAGTAPAVPTRLVRVRLQGRTSRQTTTPQPTRLWIGLHQPSRVSWSGRKGVAAAPSPPWALTVTLVGQEEEAPPLLGKAPQTRPARRSYVLSESFMGEARVLPAVWMYLELDAPDPPAVTAGDEVDEESGAAAALEFYVVPHMERTDTMDGSENTGGVREVPSWLQGGEPLSDLAALSSVSSCATTAVVAVLAECRDAVAVDVVAAPEELRAALYHDVVDRIDFSECAVVRGRGDRRGGRDGPRGDATLATSVMDVQCQLNGRCLPEYSW